MDNERNLKINSFAIQCFRNTADQDYIAARLAYRHNLVLQFQNLSHMALEKYLKAILLFNRVRAKKILHDLRKALCKLTHVETVPVVFSDMTYRFIERIDDFGNNRYLDKSYFSEGPEIIFLDRAVWEVRRFCRVLDPALTRDSELGKRQLQQFKEELASSSPEKPKPHWIEGGRLEKLLASPQHPARAALLWNNAYFSSRRRRTVKVPTNWMFENSPYFLYPEVIEEVSSYVKIPDKIVEACRSRSE